ncbi:MAG TPA: glycosyltransferase family 2 protein [Acidimicrobiales bacterium]|nr:glycosyltransferase family 2 protein [Acidimicrobiales bacterium]
MSTLRVVSSEGGTSEAELYDAQEPQFAADLAGRSLRPLVVVVAALNEEEAIGAVLDRVPQEVCGQAVDVIVVDDGSTDTTTAVARARGVLVSQLPYNRGHGVALRLGYRLAREHGARYIATLDADGQYDPVQLPDVVAPLMAGEADFVNGSRRLGAALTTDRVRKSGVVVFGALLTVLTGRRITDPASGFRAMRAEVTGAVPQIQPQYQTSELLIGAIMGGFTVVEAPVTMYPRAAGTTKKGRNLVYGARFFRVIVETWWRERSRQGVAASSVKITV